MKIRALCRSLCVSLTVSLVLFFSATAGAQGPNIKDLDAFVAKAMGEWHVPGLALALVKDDKVVHMKGYGVRELGKNVPIDVNTVFPIGSTSKAFTSSAIGLLVQDGKLAWDDRVVDYIKGFQMSDPWVTREITVRDLLCNRSGLSALSESLWYGTDYDRDEIVRRLRYVQMESSFRSQYAYRNCMFLTAGQLIPAVTGMSWDAFLKERIFRPLGMKRTFTSVRDLQNLDNVASPHLKMDGKVTPVPPRNIDNIGPAGSLNASISDMAKWLRFHMSDGVLDGKRVADAKVIQETHRPHTPIPLSPGFQSAVPWARRCDYCLSWVLLDYQGDLCVFHNGEIDGIYAVIGFIPQRRVGAVVLTNYENHRLSDVIFLRAVDMLMERAPKDWNSVYLKNRDKQEAMADQAMKAMEASRVRETKPSHPNAAYAGSYENQVYGKVVVLLEQDRLVLRLTSHLVFDLTHWHYDTFRGTCRDRVAGTRMGPTLVTFGSNSQGTVSSLNIGDDLLFTRLP